MSKKLDPEFKALCVIIRALLPLDQKARERVLRYAMDRVKAGDFPTPSKPIVLAQPDQVGFAPRLPAKGRPS